MANETITQIAEVAGVSATTVSMVINGKADNYRISAKTQQRVQDVIDKLGFVPNQQARSLRTKRTATIGLIVPDLGTHYFSNIAKIVDSHARAHAYSLYVVDSNNSIEDEQQLVQALHKRGVDGIIVASNQKNWKAKLNIPVVFLDRTIDETYSSVATNNEQSTYELCSRLIGVDVIDHRVQYIGGDSDIVSAEQRWRGFAQALQDKGIDPRQIARFDGNFSQQWGSQAMQRIAESSFSAGAIFMGAQMLTEGVLDWWKEKGGRIPEDIKLCGFDDHPFFDYLTVPISTVEQDIQTLAKTAVDMLLQHIDDSTFAVQHRVVAGKLRLRHSENK